MVEYKQGTIHCTRGDQGTLRFKHNEKALKQELVDINARLSALETAQTNTTSESEVV